MDDDLVGLVRRCAAGDQTAWNAFLPAFEDIGRRTLRTFRLPPVDQEDVLAEVLAKLYGGALRQFRGDALGELWNFLRQMVRNRALDVLGVRAREVLGDDDSWGEDAEAGSEDHAGTLADEECLRFLEAELALLPRKDRELYFMKAQGLKEREIAAQTGRPPGTVAGQIFRLVARLRKRLRERGC